MDKSSTVKMSGKEILKQGKLTIGMDLGDRSTRYCVLDQAGDVILERSLAQSQRPTEEKQNRLDAHRPSHGGTWAIASAKFGDAQAMSLYRIALPGVEYYALNHS